MFRGLITALALALGSSPAAAVIFDFKLGTQSGSTGGTVFGGSGVGGGREYTQTIAGLKVTMRATAWSYANGVFQQSVLQRFDNGLGVLSSDDGNGSGNRHTVDNDGRTDFILLQFDRNVRLTDAALHAYAIAGSNRTDNDATVGRAVVPGAWNANLSGYNGRQTNFGNVFTAMRHSYGGSASTNASNELRSLNTTGVTGKVWAISASLANVDLRKDAFKLKQLKLDSSMNMPFAGPVPEPSQWLMMIGGFGVLGAALRRRRALATA